MPGKGQISSKTLIIMVAALLLLSVAALIYVRQGGQEARVARVSVHGEMLYEIDLTAAPQEEVTLTIASNVGENVIAYRRGGIRVQAADCPDQICVKQGWLSGGLTPIVCLPHGLVIELISGGDDALPDAVSG